MDNAQPLITTDSAAPLELNNKTYTRLIANGMEWSVAIC